MNEKTTVLYVVEDNEAHYMIALAVMNVAVLTLFGVLILLK